MMNRIRELRQEKQLTQTQFAKLCQVSQTTLSGWETGSFEPGIDMITFIADYFGVSIDYLLCRTDNRNEVIQNGEIDAFAYALYGEAHDLTEAEKQDVLAYIRFRKSQRKPDD